MECSFYYLDINLDVNEEYLGENFNVCMIGFKEFFFICVER